MKIQTFSIKATVKGDKITHKAETKKLIDEGIGTEFEEKMIPKMAQEVANFNNNEAQAIKGMGNGEYTIELKIIV